MARSTDSFFIRASVTSTGGAFNQTEVDLGAYVDALGKSVLRIHSIALQTYPDHIVNEELFLHNRGTQPLNYLIVAEPYIMTEDEGVLQLVKGKQQSV